VDDARRSTFLRHTIRNAASRVDLDTRYVDLNSKILFNSSTIPLCEILFLYRKPVIVRRKVLNSVLPS
jgi:hypothetical protein